MMPHYSELARVYDTFMDNIPYEDWAGFIKGELLEHGITGNLLCELGCGTGKMTRLLSNSGFDVIGIDSSIDMLAIARENTTDDSILYLCQDMREFELYGTVSAIISVCDCMNYLSSGEELLEVFKLAANYLDNGGVMIFDMLTLHYYRDILANNVFAANREESSFIWENSFDEGMRKNSCLLTFYEKRGDHYQRYEEEHLQYAYEADSVRELLERAGLHNIKICDEYTGRDISSDSQRVVFIAVKE